MDIFFVPFLRLCIKILDLYYFFVVAYVIISWLEALGILNTYNQLVYNVNSFLLRIIDPVLLPIRNILPNLGAIDLSPLVLIFLIYFVQGVLMRLVARFPL